MDIKLLFTWILLNTVTALPSQETIKSLDDLKFDEMADQTRQLYWLSMTDDGMSQSILVPIIVLKGIGSAPVLGLVAGIHGNELNGIKVIQEVTNEIDLPSLNGIVIAIPGLNRNGILQNEREFIDGVDLNRIFPGKMDGNRSQQFVWQISHKILPHFDYLIDMHTASFGRENSYYVRADLSDESMSKMAAIQDADIMLDSEGAPSTGDQSSSTRTMRAEAMLKGIPTITVELGNPQVFQKEMIERGKKGVRNTLKWLGMIDGEIEVSAVTKICERSLWIYSNVGGFQELMVQLNQVLEKGDRIAIIRDPFGHVLKEYVAPESGIVIGLSSNPITMSGDRIIHLGVLQN